MSEPNNKIQYLSLIVSNPLILNVIRSPSIIDAKPPRITKYTLEIFLTRAKDIHGHKYDYSYVTSNHINGAMSKIPIKCNICIYEWSPTIHMHINKKSGCPNCSGKARWTYDRFIERAINLHGDRYDYSMITSDHITNCYSLFPIKCLICMYMWYVSIDKHINAKNGCPNCAGNAPLTYNKFIERATIIHGGAFDYSNITPDHIKGCNSKIPIKCNKCEYEWMPSIDNHIYSKSGCPNCAQNIPITYDQFIQKSMLIHGNNYNYSEVLPQHIVNSKSKIPVICNRCHCKWFPSINHHINNKSGCPMCNMSKGELECISCLNSMGITFKSQVQIASLPGKRYDFMFLHNQATYLLEFDGIQHFEFNERFHEDEQKFVYNQSVDVLKTRSAIKEGYNIVRIDHTQIDNIKYHIEKALSINENIYVSNLDLYNYILQYI